MGRGKVAVLFSGGKDSTLAAFYTASMGFEPELFTFVPLQEDSYMFHKACISLAPLQAKAMGMPHHMLELSGEKEKEVEEMLRHLKGRGISGISSGAVASEYQKQRVDYVAEALGVPSYSFLWHRDSEAMKDLARMEIILVKASGQGITANDVGKPFRQYGAGIHPFLEGGEGETAVLDAPFFKMRVSIQESEIVSAGGNAELRIKRAKLVPKVQAHGKD